MKRSYANKKQGHRGDKDSRSENLMNNTILSLIFISFTKLKMPAQNKSSKQKKKKKRLYCFLRIPQSTRKCSLFAIISQTDKSHTTLSNKTQ